MTFLSTLLIAAAAICWLNAMRLAARGLIHITFGTARYADPADATLSFVLAIILKLAATVFA